MRVTNVHGEKLPEQFQMCLIKVLGQLLFTLDLAESLGLSALLMKCQGPPVLIHLKSNWGSWFPYGEASSITVQSQRTIQQITFPLRPVEMSEESDGAWGRL